MWYAPTDTGVRELFLATQVEQPEPLTVIATLGDATFHDRPPVNGRKVTAEDVAASFKRFREEIGIGFDWLHNVMDDIVAVDETDHQDHAEADVGVGVHVVERRLADHQLDPPAGDPAQRRPPAEGRDRLGQWVLAGHDNGANIQLRKFQQFRQFAGTKPIAGQPFLDGINNKTISDDVAALAAFKAGDIDTYGFTGKTEAEDTKETLGDKIVVGSDLGRDYVTLMLKYEPPFTDERVRQAFNLLIDRDEAMLLLEEGSAVKRGRCRQRTGSTPCRRTTRT